MPAFSSTFDKHTICSVKIFSQLAPMVNSLVSLSVDNNIADQAGRWIYLYRRQGIQLALADTIIAATAWAHSLTLVTSNTKHFPMEDIDVLAVNH